MFTKPVHKQNPTGRRNFFAEHETVNGFTAELKVLLLSAFEKYRQFSLGGPWSATSDPAFRKVENFTEYVQVAFSAMFHKDLRCFKTDGIAFFENKYKKSCVGYM